MVPDGVWQVYTSTGVGAGGLQYPTGADAVFSVEFFSFSPHFFQFQKHFKMSFLFFLRFFHFENRII